jgi:hypothetical protein
VTPALQDRAAALGLTGPEMIELAVIELADREPWTAHPAATWRAGGDRLRAWIAAGSPEADRGQLSIVGDRRIVAAVRSVVGRLPEAVASFLVANAMIVCTGRDSRGWCGEWPVPPCATPVLVALADDDHAIIAHELAHAWHRRPLPAAARLDAAQLERLHAAVREIDIAEGRVDERIEDVLANERMADELACLFGFPIDTTSGEAGAYRRRLLGGP